MATSSEDEAFPNILDDEKQQVQLLRSIFSGLDESKSGRIALNPLLHGLEVSSHHNCCHLFAISCIVLT